MESKADTLVLIWSSRDREVAKNMVFMYAKNSRLKNWWPAVRLVVWGPSASLLAEDAELQAELEELKRAGVELLACRACADKYGVAPRLEELGLQVIYMGAPLTEYLQTGLPVLTF
ncbi:DsrE family protein [Desulfoferula mesophila]|uniref:DsrE family protein n=1 Tax=Desulfoferula mesophila TaxID=3058419 RepID=A0AAU9EZA9_9BACT|nr:hypothetical protein FAK_39210 [Desulfoferula mesophilus]